MKDIVLIGMPGCGKSTIGRMLAGKYNLPFLDLDESIEKMTQRKISEIFATDGEKIFRDMETKALKEAVGFGRVLATGGGIVAREENRAIVEKGILVFIDRPLQNIMGDIETVDRPLLAEGKEKLLRLYQERYEKYLGWATIHIKNDKSPENAIEKIIKEVERYENYGD